MDFALLPPEVNSGRMYAGPGPGPLLAAAAAWDALAAELQTVGAACASVIGELNDSWSGPSATAMAAAVAPYATWMHTTSAQAEQTAVQAKAAAAAYETAFTMTVPPPVVAANRAALMSLLATNFLGQNTPAIAATEARYAQMWAQDAAAMYGYAHSAAAASRLTAFTEPPQTTNPAGSAGRAGAAGHAVTHALQGLASPATARPLAEWDLLAALAPAAAGGPGIVLALAGGDLIIEMIGNFGIDVLGTFLIDALGAVEYADVLLPLELAGSVTPVAAGLGEAVVLSGLSVPQAWTVAAASATQPADRSLPAAADATVPVIETAAPIAGMAAAGLAGRATAAIGRGDRDGAGRTRQSPVPPQLPPQRSQQPQRLPYALLLGIDIELRELAELREARVLTDEEYAQQKRRLLGR